VKLRTVDVPALDLVRGKNLQGAFDALPDALTLFVDHVSSFSGIQGHASEESGRLQTARAGEEIYCDK
jgi:hypothetical protein